jgi:hypothetical protein
MNFVLIERNPTTGSTRNNITTVSGPFADPEDAEQAALTALKTENALTATVLTETQLKRLADPNTKDIPTYVHLAAKNTLALLG